MIIHILIPSFWIAVEEQRRPELRERPVIVGSSFLDKGAGQVRVVMVNALAREFGVSPGMTLAHARQLCPEAVMLAPELPLYDGVWDEIMPLLLTYTPVVQSLDPGEAVCDVSGSERLFGDPVSMAQEITHQIQAASGLPAVAGVGGNRLVAQLAASSLDNPRSRSGDGSSQVRTLGLPSEGSVVFVAPGQEAAFLRPFPVTALPDIDSQMLIAFQVLGLKKIEHLAQIPAAAFESRFGLPGRRLAQYARGRDDRPVQPAPRAPALSVSRRCDDDSIEGLEPDRALVQLVESLAADLSIDLKKRRLAGRLITLSFRMPREGKRPSQAPGGGPSDHPNDSTSGRSFLRLLLVKPSHDGEASRWSPRDRNQGSVSQEQFFPNQDSRIHSMLPQPLQPGRGRSPAPGSPFVSRCSPSPESVESQPAIDGVVLRSARTVCSHPVDNSRTMAELGYRLLLRILKSGRAEEIVRPGVELHLEISHFAAPEQMTLPGLDGRPLDRRLDRLHRQENVLTSRFGATPFRHLASVDLDSVLSERIFRWGHGLGR
jgi:DNA polymerase-4